MNIRIIAKHSKFKSVPNSVFYFKEYKDFKKYEEKLIKLGFTLTTRLKFKRFNLVEIKEILKHNIDCKDLPDIKSKKEIIKKYSKKYEL